MKEALLDSIIENHYSTQHRNQQIHRGELRTKRHIYNIAPAPLAQGTLWKTGKNTVQVRTPGSLLGNSLP